MALHPGRPLFFVLLAACVSTDDHESSDNDANTCVLDCEGDADTDADSDTDADADSDSDSDADADQGRRFDHFVDTTDAYIGDTTCLGDDPPQPDEACHEVMTVSGSVRDFQDNDVVADADVAWWTDDDPSGAADAQSTTNSSGQFSLSAWACQPMAVRTSTPPEWEQTVDTLRQHTVYGWESDGKISVVAASFGESTARLIPALVGDAWDRASGLISGIVVDCAGDAVENAQIFVHDAGGDGASDMEVYYFDDDTLPAAHDDQPDSSDNGLWVAINVPPGEWTADAWGWDGGEYVLLGSTPLLATAGAATILEIVAGQDDGIDWPASCTDACGE